MTIADITEGKIVQHFKRELLSAEERSTSMYLYEILCTAVHTETEQQLVVYRALYGDKKVYARPLEMFISPVDREKYPQIKQAFRFEPINDNN